MQLQFHGAVRTVTGSQHLLKVNGRQILLDCGIYQGKRQDSYERNQKLPYNAAEIDVLILSHAHIDHSGNIPNLVKSGFRGDIICTYATRDLCAIMLQDSGKIQEQDIGYLNKRRKREKLPPLEPIYTQADALESLKYFIGLGYERSYQVMPGVSLTFYDAGHILGSAMVVLDIDDHETSSQKRLIFSGDIGRDSRPILRDPSFFKEADILIMESTYGNREHSVDAPSNDMLADIVGRTIQRKGKVIVPAFAVGRSQEIVYRLHELIHAGRIPEIPIYIDSPLAINATSVYRLHPEAYDQEMANMILSGHRPFDERNVFYTRTKDESRKINNVKGAAVVISASGMAETGRILHHLIHNIENPKNSVLIVGWQAPHTLGRRIVEKEPVVRIFGKEHKLNAEVAVLNGFSGHAGRSELLEWCDHFTSRPKHTFLVHGEMDAASALKESLEERDFTNVHVPELGQSFSV